MAKEKKYTITQKDFLLANRKAARQEEIDAHGKQIIFRSVKQKSRKAYDRKTMKRADIDTDDGSFCYESGPLVNV